MGGFYSVNQLTEVYGLSDSLVQVIIPHLQNTQNFKKIKINEADVKAFGKHPYLEWKDANLIIKYRKHNYPITKDSFKTMMGISKETKTKVLPYLDFSLKENDAVTEDLNEGKSDTKLPVIKDDSVDVKIDSMKTEGNINHVTKTDVSEMD